MVLIYVSVVISNVEHFYIYDNNFSYLSLSKIQHFYLFSIRLFVLILLNWVPCIFNINILPSDIWVENVSSHSLGFLCTLLIFFPWVIPFVYLCFCCLYFQFIYKAPLFRPVSWTASHSNIVHPSTPHFFREVDYGGSFPLYIYRHLYSLSIYMYIYI